MTKDSTHPAFWPPEVPGYVPFNNNSKHDDAAIADMLTRAGIKEDDAVTLRDVVPGIESTTYVAAIHARYVEERSRRLDLVLRLMMDGLR